MHGPIFLLCISLGVYGVEYDIGYRPVKPDRDMFVEKLKLGQVGQKPPFDDFLYLPDGGPVFDVNYDLLGSGAENLAFLEHRFAQANSAGTPIKYVYFNDATYQSYTGASNREKKLYLTEKITNSVELSNDVRGLDIMNRSIPLEGGEAIQVMVVTPRHDPDDPAAESTAQESLEEWIAETSVYKRPMVSVRNKSDGIRRELGRPNTFAFRWDNRDIPLLEFNKNLNRKIYRQTSQAIADGIYYSTLSMSLSSTARQFTSYLLKREPKLAGKDALTVLSELANIASNVDTAATSKVTAAYHDWLSAVSAVTSINEKITRSVLHSWGRGFNLCNIREEGFTVRADEVIEPFTRPNKASGVGEIYTAPSEISYPYWRGSTMQMFSLTTSNSLSRKRLILEDGLKLKYETVPFEQYAIFWAHRIHHCDIINDITVGRVHGDIHSCGMHRNYDPFDLLRVMLLNYAKVLVPFHKAIHDLIKARDTATIRFNTKLTDIFRTAGVMITKIQDVELSEDLKLVVNWQAKLSAARRRCSRNTHDVTPRNTRLMDEFGSSVKPSQFIYLSDECLRGKVKIYNPHSYTRWSEFDFQFDKILEAWKDAQKERTEE